MNSQSAYPRLCLACYPEFSKSILQMQTSSSNDSLKSLGVYHSSPKAWYCLFLSYSNKVYVELMVGNKERHTCLAYFAKSKTESTGDSKSYKNDQDVQVCGM